MVLTFVTLTSEYMMSIDAYWISPDGDHHPITTTHFNYVLENPSIFGLTKANIQVVYENQAKKTKNAAPAGDLIIKSLQRKGWIHISFDPRSNSYTIRYAVQIKSIKSKVYEWIQQNVILANDANFYFIHSDYKPTFVYNREIVKFLTVKNYTIEERCLNCKHSVWAVGVGQGFFCRNIDKINQGGDRVIGREFKRYLIPNRNYICEFFERKSCSCDLKP